MNILNELAAWTVLAIWFLGALLAVIVLGLSVHWAGWFLYKELVGWPTIFKAVREYKARHEGEKPLP